MLKVCLFFLTSEQYDCASVFEKAFQDSGYAHEVVRYPHFFLPTRERLRDLRARLRNVASTHFVILFADTTELFLKEPNYTLAFSAYRNWYNPSLVRVIPHLWTPVKAPTTVDSLKWNDKPPLRVGFMGSAHSTSRLAQIVRRSPKFFKERCLQGSFLRQSGLRAAMNDFGVALHHINSFSRLETLDAVRENKACFPDVDIDIVETGFAGSAEQKKAYQDHLQQNTYILCPRGSENYSFRIYEALRFGRVPVIIDTNVVLPPEIDWSRLSVRVPYNSLNSILDHIREDYRAHSGDQFAERQREALSTMANLQSMRWAKDLVNQLGEARGFAKLPK
jgi:hypothetical protein